MEKAFLNKYEFDLERGLQEPHMVELPELVEWPEGVPSTEILQWCMGQIEDNNETITVTAESSRYATVIAKSWIRLTLELSGETDPLDVLWNWSITPCR